LQIGSKVKVWHKNGQFSLTGDFKSKTPEAQQGDLVVCRFVKVINGKGIIV
jgi:hypothetical protein